MSTGDMVGIYLKNKDDAVDIDANDGYYRA